MLDLFHHPLIGAISKRLMIDDFRAPRFFIDPLELQTVRDTLISEIQLRDLNGLDSGLPRLRSGCPRRRARQDQQLRSGRPRG